MQIPKIGRLEMDHSTSPLLFFPLRAKTAMETSPINATLGTDYPSDIQTQPQPIYQHKTNHLPIRSKKTPQENLKLGPFVAILTSDSREPFAGNHRNFADLIQMGRKMGITVYVLTPKGIQPGKSYVNGFLLRQTKSTHTFQKSILPFPNVVYNRIPYRKDEESPSIQAAIKYIKHKNIPMFNPNFFNKWSLFRDLSPSACHSHLPDTTKFTNYLSFKQMKAKHHSLILKPVEGKAGIGMIKVEGNGPFVLYYQTKKQKQRIVLSQLQQVYQQIKKRIGYQGYIIQKGIALATYEGRPFDIRMLVQKDCTAEWKISGIGVRVAGQSAISTHVPMGGRIENFQLVLAHSFPTQKKSLQHQLKQVGIQFAKEIELRTEKHLGEMSMDIGIDKKGKLWFFEANAKPQKFDEPLIRKTSLRRILEYSLYLSSFSPIKKVENA